MDPELNFESLHIKIPDIIKKYPLEKQQEIFDYLTKDSFNNKAKLFTEVMVVCIRITPSPAFLSASA